jgi:hypothetical protein
MLSQSQKASADVRETATPLWVVLLPEGCNVAHGAAASQLHVPSTIGRVTMIATELIVTDVEAGSRLSLQLASPNPCCASGRG